jgi:hypothetical protein
MAGNQIIIQATPHPDDLGVIFRHTLVTHGMGASKDRIAYSVLLQMFDRSVPGLSSCILLDAAAA